MGGAFGGKEVQANPYAAIAALGAWKTRRPVRVRLTRELDIAITGKRHPYLAKYAAGLRQRRPAERRSASSCFPTAVGASILSEPIMWRSLFHIDNAYKLPAVEVIGRVCRTHKTSQTAFRGFGGPQGMLVIEEILSRAAQRLGLPAEVVRERNFYRQRRRDSLRRAGARRRSHRADLEHAEGIQRVRAAASRSSRASMRGSAHQKRGIAITPVKFGISFTATFYNQAGAVVLVYRDGTVQVNHGGTEMGQGLFTKILQIAADSLGVPHRAGARHVDAHRQGAEHVGDGGVFGKRSEWRGGRRMRACRSKRGSQQSRRRCSTATADVQFDDGVVSARGKSIAFGALCETAYKQRIPLFAEGFYRTPDIHFDFKTARGRPFHYYAYGAAVSEVEVDGFTGAVPPAAHRHPSGRRRFDFAGRRSRADRRRLSSGGRLAHDRRAVVGRDRARQHGRVRLPTSCRRGLRCPRCSTSRCWSARRSPMSSWAAKLSASRR